MPGPLAGVRVLELARILAGPWAGQVLADLGADVIKVERSKTGDDTRAWGPPFIEGKDGHLGAAYFHSTNRGKRSIECDFESEDGKRIVRKLAAKSDILIENFKVGGLKKFGLDYASLAPSCPRLIYCSVTGFGQTGPDASRAGYDLMAQGIGGFMALTGTADGEPTRAGVPVSDIFTGVYSVIGILAALQRRERTGKGGYVDTALVDSTVGVLANQAMNYLASGVAPKRIGNAHPNIVPYQVFPVADGHIIIATGQRLAVREALHGAGRAGAVEAGGVSGQQGPAEQPQAADRSPLGTDEKIQARRSPGEARSGRRAGRADQRSRSGVRGPAGRASRHEDRCARATPRKTARSPACARRSCSTASRWRRKIRRRGWASIRRRYCGRSGSNLRPHPEVPGEAAPRRMAATPC